MALFGKVETVRIQAPSSPVFAIGWAYVQELLDPKSVVHQRLARMAAGTSEKREVGGGVFVLEQAYETKVRADGFFESHRKYVDIQVVVSGEETIEVVDVSRATVRAPYQESRELIEYHDAAGSSLLRLHAGEVAIFFPADVHMGGLRTGTVPVLVRKAVLKLPVGG